MKIVLALIVVIISLITITKQDINLNKNRDEFLTSLGGLIEAREKNGKLTLQDNEANIDEYIDKFFTYLKEFINNTGLNDIALPNTTLTVLAGHSNLTSGSLEGISSIIRTDDATVTYSTDDNKRLKLVLPFEFENLDFKYHYHTLVTVISMSGEIEGTIQNAKFNTELSFYFGNDSFFLDHLDMKHTGTIHVEFSDNAALDWLTNAMSEAITTVLHPLIVGEVQKTIRTELRVLVEDLNEIIYNYLHPTTVIVV